MPEPGARAAGIVRYGWGALRTVEDVLSELKAERVLIISGGTSFTRSGAQRAVEGLGSRFVLERWSDFSPDVDVTEIARGRAVLARFGPDTVLAVGGGSVLDMAKLLVSWPQGRDAEEFVSSGEGAMERVARLVLAPTTSGSGAEATHFAVAYVGERKYSIAGPAMRPDAIVLDPALTLSASRYQRACSAIDAFAQAIESLWAVGATSRSRAFARAALRFIAPNIHPYVVSDVPSAARAMTIGSHLAGRAIDISRTTGAHALAYHLTKRYGVPHGEAVAATLGRFLRTHREAVERRPAGQDLALLSGALDEIDGALSSALVPSRPAEEHAWEELCRSIGLRTRMADLGVVGRDRIEAYAASVDPVRLVNNPVALDHRGLVSLLQSAR